MDSNRITAARVLADHLIEISFADGFVGQVDLMPVLWGPVFEPLKDAAFFSKFRLEDDTVRWPNDADFCPDVLRYWCETGEVKSQEETDAYFAKDPFMAARQ
jgi:hypothetical protein